jgi:ERCC4-related helicase
MKKSQIKFTQIVAVAVLLVYITNPLASHAHDHGHKHANKAVTKHDIKDTAKRQLKRLIRTKKIPKSWAKTKISTIEKKKFNNKLEWVVKFINRDIEDSNKQTLYIFVNKRGYVKASNYSGR